MADDFLERAEAMLVLDEGQRLKPYDDKTGRAPVLARQDGMGRVVSTGGNVTIGVGHNLTAKGISQTVANELLQEDLDSAITDAKSIFGAAWLAWSVNRRLAITNLLFAMGKTEFLTFHHTIAHIKSGNWTAAAADVLASEWAKTVGERARRVSKLMNDEDPYTP